MEGKTWSNGSLGIVEVDFRSIRFDAEHAIAVSAGQPQKSCDLQDTLMEESLGKLTHKRKVQAPF